MSNQKTSDYPFTVRPLSEKEGGGYFIEFPDLPGCVSDGDTIEEAIANGKDAVKSWIKAAREMKREIPTIKKQEKQSGKWVQRVPKSIHSRLINIAREEKTSLNTLVITMITESLAHRSQSYFSTKHHEAKKNLRH